MSDTDAGGQQCENCGEQFEKGDGVSGSGSVKSDGLEKLTDGQSIGISELFAFDESYCSMDCVIAAGDDSE